MTRATKDKKARHQGPRSHKRQARVPPGLLIVALLGLASAILAGVLLWRGNGGGEKIFSGIPAGDPGPVHVHGLGVNPADGTLFIATHTGLYEVAQGMRKATRVGERFQDTMGFTVVGPNRFLGSGHPDINEARSKGLPPLLGLIESTDAGKSWEPVSLLGEADFHVLRFASDRVYGYDATNDRLLVSADRGRTWNELDKPGPLVDLAVDPGDGRRIVAAAAGDLEQGLYESRNGGETWQRLGEAVGLLAWPASKQLYIVPRGGQVFRSGDGGRRLEHRGEIGGEPAALIGEGADELYIALHDGTIKRSIDGGSTWIVRSRP